MCKFQPAVPEYRIRVPIGGKKLKGQCTWVIYELMKFVVWKALSLSPPQDDKYAKNSLNTLRFFHPVHIVSFSLHASCFHVLRCQKFVCWYMFLYICVMLENYASRTQKVVSQGCMHDASKFLTVGANALFTTISETLNHQNNIRLYQWPRGLVLHVIHKLCGVLQSAILLVA